MGTLFTRRNLIALASGLVTIAIVTTIVISLNLRQPQRTALAMATPSATSFSYTVYSTPTTGAQATPTTPPASPTQPGSPTTASSGKGRTPPTSLGPSDTPPPTTTATATATVGATGVPGASPTATATTTTGLPTATSTPANPVDDAAVIGSYTVNTKWGAGGWLTVQIEMLNTGTTTWPAGWSYDLGCVSNCMGASPGSVYNVAPGQSDSIGIQLDPPTPFTTATYYSKWSMFHSGAPFGAVATVKIVATVATPLGTDPAPGCDSSGMSWSVTGGATCANGGLAMTTNSAQEPRALLQSAPSGFNSANYRITVQARFSSVTTDWVRVMGYYGGTQCNAQGVDVQPDATFRTFYIVNCKETDGLWYAWSNSSSPITVSLDLQSGSFMAFINGHAVQNGGSLFTSGYPAVSVGGNDGNVVTLTNGELDTPVTPYTNWNVVQA